MVILNCFDKEVWKWTLLSTRVLGKASECLTLFTVGPKPLYAVTRGRLCTVLGDIFVTRQHTPVVLEQMSASQSYSIMLLAAREWINSFVQPATQTGVWEKNTKKTEYSYHTTVVKSKMKYKKMKTALKVSLTSMEK